LVRIDVAIPTNFELRLPTQGNANFIPGGQTSGGITEGMVNPIPKGTPGVTEVIIQ
jgi:hypothetical protein